MAHVVESSSLGRVLVVEDDADLREIIVGFLDSKGWRAEGRRTARTERDRSASLDGEGAVVLDVRSFASEGFRMLERLRRSTPDVAVIVIASFGDSFVARSAERLGAATVLEKPFALEDLERALLRIVTDRSGVATRDGHARLV